MRDTSRPSALKTQSELSLQSPRSRHPSISQWSSSDTSHNQRFSQDDISLDRNTTSRSEPVISLPWRNIKARAGRGDLVKSNLTRCSQREIDLGLTLVAAAWATGNLELQWLFWPERDEISLGNCVFLCWEMVKAQQVKDDFEDHLLEPIVARKV